MSSKALRKQLLAAVAMVIVAAIAVTSSTFAWFAANTTVTAQGMSVTAKSDASFLLIKAGTQTAAAVRTGALTADSATTATAALFPAAHTTAAGVGYTIDDIEDDDTTNMTDWYFKNSNDPATSNVDVTAAQDIAVADFDKYVLANEFTIALADGSNDVENLKVGTCTITATGDEAVKVIVATDYASEEFSGAGGSGTVVLRNTGLTDGANDIETVRIYIYWDGNDADVYTNGIADLLSTAVTVTFVADVVAA
ncbi:MAG: hypothetical protein IJT18_05315 [Oscillospiraceae bacterium]|nr:hypothetical protein [Oscillospiraceae bacterium]